MAVRGIRGAISVTENTAREIIDKTKEMIQEMITQNEIQQDDIAGAFFTVTSDLNAEFPAKAARNLGWDQVPMICQTEIAVPGSLAGIIRVLVLLNTEKSSREMKHIYLGKAKSLRPDWIRGTE